MSDTFWFDSWSELIRVIVVGSLAYVALIIILRTSGKRTLSRMNAFDLVVTVALGSTLGTIIPSKDVALAEGLVALALLVGLQYLIGFLSVRSTRFSDVIKSEPTLVLFRGSYLSERMRAVRVVDAEVLAAVRSAGISSLDDVEAVVLESDGPFNAIRRSDVFPTALTDTNGFDQQTLNDSVG